MWSVWSVSRVTYRAYGVRRCKGFLNAEEFQESFAVFLLDRMNNGVSVFSFSGSFQSPCTRYYPGTHCLYQCVYYICNSALFRC